MLISFTGNCSISIYIYIAQMHETQCTLHKCISCYLLDFIQHALIIKHLKNSIAGGW